MWNEYHLMTVIEISNYKLVRLEKHQRRRRRRRKSNINGTTFACIIVLLFVFWFTVRSKAACIIDCIIGKHN
ncbi:hypothetical protein Peur_032115 [Populus x canadensis]